MFLSAFLEQTNGTARDSSDDEEETELKILEKEINELREAKKEVFERSLHAHKELERYIALYQRERERVDNLIRHRVMCIILVTLIVLWIISYCVRTTFPTVTLHVT